MKDNDEVLGVMHDPTSSAEDHCDHLHELRQAASGRRPRRRQRRGLRDL